MHVHIVAVAGTGMGSLAGLLRELGHDVSGSDVAFDPPMGPALEQWGVRCMRGFDPAHLEPRPDLVVIGNVCRSDNPEARAALDGGMEVTHIAGALQRFALDVASPLVVAGTHGKTTTSSLCAQLLDRAGLEPGFLIGGIPGNFARGFRAPKKGRRLPVGPAPARRAPFVVEGDEYDTAFFEKTAKFLHYRAEVAIITSIEHDHIDIYPTEQSYLDAFRMFVRGLPESGLLIANGADVRVAEVADECPATVEWFALADEDFGGRTPHWLAAPAGGDSSGASFDLFAGGVAVGRYAVPLSGRHNVKNALAAMAACTRGFGAPLDGMGTALGDFRGVKRRQELLGTPGGVHLYDDFAHHPTAVRETLAGLRARHPRARLLVLFEPRSATACRRIHQAAYGESFDAADAVWLAPLGRDNVPDEERLDLHELARAIAARGPEASVATSSEEIERAVCERASSGDVVAVLSNGAFGGMPSRLLAALGR